MIDIDLTRRLAKLNELGFADGELSDMIENVKNIADKSEEICFCACVHKIKSSGGFYFVLLRTGRYILQSVYRADMCEGDFDALCEGSYVKVRGAVKKEERAPYGYEITLSSFEILSKPKEEYPLSVSSSHLGCSVETSMEHRSAALRHPEERAVFRINEGAVAAFRSFMTENGFTEIHTPKLSAAYDTKNAFKLRYFGQDAQLAKTAQPYLCMSVAFFDRVFETGHVYRADRHNSARHLSEFISLDFEMAFIEDIRDVMAVETAMLKHILSHLEAHYAHELDMLGKKLPVIDNIPCVSFYEAIDILGKPHNQPDLDPTDEVKLCRWAKKNCGSELVFIERLPSVKRPLYDMDCRDNPLLSESFVLLFRGMEISSGGQRIHDYDEQLEKLTRRDVKNEKYGAYLDSLRYGMPPHGGAKIGLERFVMKLLDLENIRQASLFPRDLHHLES